MKTSYAENTYKKSQKKRENKKDPQGTAKKKKEHLGILVWDLRFGSRI